MRVLRAIDRGISEVEKVLLLVMLCLIVGVNLLQIGFRLAQSFLRLTGSEVVLDAPSWPADVNRVLVLWITMIGGSLATRRMEHIKVDFVGRLLRQGWLRAILQAAVCLAGVVISALLVLFSIDFIKMEYELQETLVAIPIPLWLIQVIIPVGFVAIGFRFFLFMLGGPEAEPEHERAARISNALEG